MKLSLPSVDTGLDMIGEHQVSSGQDLGPHEIDVSIGDTVQFIDICLRPFPGRLGGAGRDARTDSRRKHKRYVE